MDVSGILTTYRVDAVLFVVLLLVMTVGMHCWLRRKHQHGLPVASLVTMLTLAGFGFTLPEYSGQQERERLRDMVSGIAPTYAQELELLGHDKIHTNTSAEDPRYLAMIEAQIRWEKANPGVSDIYTFRKLPSGEIGLIVDSETDYDHSGKYDQEREQRTAIGEVYSEPTDGMVASLDGNPGFDGVPYTDRWGTWVSAFYPLRDAQGNVDAVVGVDYDARQWLDAIARARASTLGFLGVVAASALAASVVVVVTRAELVRRTIIENERGQLQEQLIQASRKAGMAEIATGVLHNVGNVLNSVNVSARMISDKLQASRLPSLGKFAALIRHEQARLGEFVTQDPRGKSMPDFVEQLHVRLRDDQGAIEQELEQLVHGIEHIKEVVRMQQNSATDSTVVAATDPVAIMEDAVKINLVSLERHQVDLVRRFDRGLQEVLLDKHKVLQILINLISNAKKATCHPDITTRCITLGIRRIPDGQSIEFSVQDNGVGISHDNMEQMFRHGFTAFKDGHGFGLHSGANAATEMKGALKVHSDGPGTGAKFTLTLPLVAVSAKELAA